MQADALATVQKMAVSQTVQPMEAVAVAVAVAAVALAMVHLALGVAVALEVALEVRVAIKGSDVRLNCGDGCRYGDAGAAGADFDLHSCSCHRKRGWMHTY